MSTDHSDRTTRALASVGYIWGNVGTTAYFAGWNWGNSCGLEFNDFFQWGRDAFNDGTVRPDHEPYTYPHPLVSPRS